MDIYITSWELSLEEHTFQEIKEGIATGPMKPYPSQPDTINWN